MENSQVKFHPMLAKIHKNEKIFDGDYIFEPKLDGYRALCYKNSGLRFFSRNGINMTASFPELQKPNLIKAESAVLDGEIVVYNKKGLPDFNLIQNRENITSTANVVFFDILMKNNNDLTSLPLAERKKILKKTVVEKSNFQIIPFTKNGKSLLRQIKKLKLEGIMAKKEKSFYHQGRNSDWLKIKLVKTLDCVITGYTGQKKDISSLLLGIYEKKKLIFVGKVGTGFNERNLPELRKKFKELSTVKYLNLAGEKNIFWLKPKLVAEIKFSEITPDKKLRAPVFLRLRDDKNPNECGWDG